MFVPTLATRINARPWYAFEYPTVGIAPQVAFLLKTVHFFPTLRLELELATDVHPQVTALLKEQSMLNRQLIARDERIQLLEAQLQEAQDTLVAQNQRYAPSFRSLPRRCGVRSWLFEGPSGLTLSN
ncbi:hypothetical protein BC936DRAFT_147611 [Jimgerdemannia flammicorona]|uniref:Uncharacterized protein n=1 Tax=Jimgerdemannia flammicorona TaxID=994334 RepID=A0A433D4Z3_9FUNG|nr:hypothetical protein BC936DRAFT_147611 [Jimgerdemannia flammicorona]